MCIVVSKGPSPPVVTVVLLENYFRMMSVVVGRVQSSLVFCYLPKRILLPVSDRWKRDRK